MTTRHSTLKPRLLLKPRFLHLFLILIIPVSCNNPNRVTDSEKGNSITLPYRIDIEENIKNFKSFPLSTLGQEIEYVILETSPRSLIRKINQIHFTDNYIFISDFDRLVQFDRSGKFIRQVGGAGRGPTEYIHISDFCVDEINEKIYLKAWGINTIKEFDFDGKFIHSFKISFSSLQFLKSDKNSYTFIIPNNSGSLEAENRLIVTDSTGTVKMKIKNYNVYHKSNIIATKIPLYYFKDTIRINESRVDTLNSFVNGKHIPYAIFNLGKYKMDPDQSIPFETSAREELNNRVKDKIWIWSINENNTYLFLTFNIGLSDSSAYAFYNKLDSKFAFLDKSGFDDDLGIGIPFWPRYIYHDSLLVDYQDAFKVLKHMNKISKSKNYQSTERINELSKTLKETSNPILILIKSR